VSTPCHAGRKPPQHVRVAPLALDAARAQLAADQVAGALEPAQHRAEVDAVARRQLGRRERPVRARVAADDPHERLVHRLDERLRQPAWRHGAEPVAVQAGVLGGDPALLPADAHRDRAPLGAKLVEHALRVDALHAARLRLAPGQVAQCTQHVVERVDIRCLHSLGQVLQVGLDLRERVRVDQVAQLLLAEQLAQQVAVERERRGAPLRVRRVALVHVGRHVVEQQGRGERRRALRLHLDQREVAPVELRQEVGQAGQVEDVAQALAVRLEHDRELPVALGDLEQRLRLQALLPQRGALAGVCARQQQRAGRVLAEARAEKGRCRQLTYNQVLDLVGLDHDQLGSGRLVGVGQVDDDPVVRPDRVGLEAELVADARAQSQSPGGVDASAERRQHAQAPVADLVAEPLDHDRPVARHDAGRLLLLAQVGDEVLGRALVQVVAGLDQLGRLAVDGPARELPDRAAELRRAPDRVALPERDRAGSAGCRRDDDAVARDLLDPPRRRTEQEDLAGTGLVDHLLVELADTPAVGQVHA
jgi:hypothetical protein